MILRENIKAQSTIEFTFVMVTIIFLIYGMVMLFRWAGLDLANRRVAQDSSLTALVEANGQNVNGDPSLQLNNDIDSVLPIAAVYHGAITSNVTTNL